MGSNPSTGRYIVACMTTGNGCPLSLGSIPSDRLKNLKNVDKCSSLSLCLSEGNISNLRLSAKLVKLDGTNSILSPAVQLDISLSINKQYY